MPGSHVPVDFNDVVHGGDVYRNDVRLDFSVNLNPLPMPESVRMAMLEGVAGIHNYPDPFQQRLRERIADAEDVSAGNIVCGNGASELLMAAVHAFRPGKALITAPCYAGYARALEAADAEVVEYKLDEKKGFVLDGGFVSMISDDTDMVFVADPNNPNGRRIDPRTRKDIIRTSEEKGAVLVIDECFLPLTGAGTGKETAMDGALHLRAFTKTFAIPGVRLGYMLSGDTGRLDRIRKHLPEWNVSRIAERTGEAAAEVLAGTDYLERAVNEIRAERIYLRQELMSCGMRVYDSDANYLLFRGEPDLYERLLKKGILIRKCANFSGLDDTYYRIAVRAHGDNEALIKVLREEVQAND